MRWLLEKLSEGCIEEEPEDVDISDCEGENAEDEEDVAREVEVHHGSEEQELVEVDHRPEQLGEYLAESRSNSQDGLRDNDSE